MKKLYIFLLSIIIFVSCTKEINVSHEEIKQDITTQEKNIQNTDDTLLDQGNKEKIQEDNRESNKVLNNSKDKEGKEESLNVTQVEGNNASEIDDTFTTHIWKESETYADGGIILHTIRFDQLYKHTDNLLASVVLDDIVDNYIFLSYYYNDEYQKYVVYDMDLDTYKVLPVKSEAGNAINDFVKRLDKERYVLKFRDKFYITDKELNVIDEIVAPSQDILLRDISSDGKQIIYQTKGNNFYGNDLFLTDSKFTMNQPLVLISKHIIANCFFSLGNQSILYTAQSNLGQTYIGKIDNQEITNQETIDLSQANQIEKKIEEGYIKTNVEEDFSSWVGENGKLFFLWDDGILKSYYYDEDNYIGGWKNPYHIDKMIREKYVINKEAYCVLSVDERGPLVGGYFYDHQSETRDNCIVILQFDKQNLGEMNEDNYFKQKSIIGNPRIFLYDDTIIANPDSRHKDEFVYYNIENRYNRTYSTGDYYFQKYDRDKHLSLKTMKEEMKGSYVDDYNQVRKIKDTVTASKLIEEPYQAFDYSDEIIAYTQLASRFLVKLEDEEKTILTNSPVNNIRVIDDAIFYYDENNVLYRHKNDEEIRITEGISSNIHVIDDYIYFIDSNKDLYRYNVINSHKLLLGHEVSLLASDNDIVYYVKANNSPDDELYRIKNTDETSIFMRIIDFQFVNVLFAVNNKVYFGGLDPLISFFSSIGQEIETFSNTVLYENDNTIIYYVPYITYEEGYANIIIYDKENHKIQGRMTDWMTADSKSQGEWLYVSSEEANIYRISIETLEIQHIYEGIAFDLGSAPNYLVIDNDNIIVSQATYKDNNYFHEIIWLTIETQNKEVLPIQGLVLYKDGNTIYYVDKGLLFAYNYTTKMNTKIADHEASQVVYYDQDYLYVAERYQPNNCLLRIQKNDFKVDVLVDNAHERNRWFCINNDVYFTNKSNELIHLKLMDLSQVVMVNNTICIVGKMIKKDGIYLRYLTQEENIEHIKIMNK